VHGGGSGVGTAAIALCKEAGLRILVTAGSPEKCRRCLEHGADVAIDYRTEDFAERAREATGGKGVDLVLDSIGARYLAQNVASLAIGGRLVLIGLMGGARGEIDLAMLLMKRLRVIGSTLRARPAEEKASIVEALGRRFGAALAAGRLKPVVDRVLPLAEAAEAHRLVKSSVHFGKIALRVA
jgi:NADPH:quinone reductase-like Zn-dependent oxidoreductase